MSNIVYSPVTPGHAVLPRRLAAAARKYLLAGRIAVRNRWQYPAEQLGPLLTFSLFAFIQARIWAVAYAGTPEIAGYTQAASTWYFIVAEMAYMAGSGAFGQLARDIKDGQVAYILGRPFGFVLWNGAQRLALGLNQLLVLALPGILIGCLAVGPLAPAGPGQIAALLAALVLALAVQYCLQAAIAMTAFWFEENSAFIWIFSKIALVAGTLIPLEFLPDSWQSVLWWTPFPWLAWAPARIAVLPDAGLAGLPGGGAAPGAATWLVLLGMQLAWLAASAALASGVFRLAARRTTIQGG
jgi:ABC-2 type transport system permease protein